MPPNLRKLVLKVEWSVRSVDWESHVHPSVPQMLSNRQSVATNIAKKRCYEISNATDRDFSKNATKLAVTLASYVRKKEEPY